jgi:uncharacterized protein (DUF1800 family)
MKPLVIARKRIIPATLRRALAFSALLALLLTGVPAESAAPQAAPRRMSEERRVVHVLNRLGYGPRPGDVERVMKIGLDRYLDEQLHPEKINDRAAEEKLSDLPSLGMSTPELYAKYPNPGMLIRRLQKSGELPADLAELREKMGAAGAATPADGMKADAADKKDYRRAVRDYYVTHNLLPPQRLLADLQAARIRRAVYSERQLQEVMVDFWSNHFNVFAGKGADRWLLVSYDRDTIRPHALGNFSELLLATAQSPAMLFYLDNFQSVSPTANDRFRRNNALRRMMSNQAPQRPRRGINENYARELMELHTLGVDGGYTQKDVQEVARCFTGWTILAPRGGLAGAEGMNPDAGKFVFNARLHDDGEKVVLGHKIQAGGGIKDGLMVLDILARHPSTARFVATKLSRRFVADEPSRALVDRVAAAFTRSNGDIKETLRAIFTSPEFNSTAAYRAKIKTPFELAVSAIRAVGGETNGHPPIHQWVAKMGEPLYQYQAPTGYPDTAEAWVNTGALLERLNFSLALAGNRIPGTRADLARLTDGGVGAAPAVVADQLMRVILQNDVSPGTRTTLLKQLHAAGGTETTPVKNTAPDVAKIVGLILGSPEFQRQ